MSCILAANMALAGSTGETEFSTQRTTDDTSGKLPTSTTFILGSDSVFQGSTMEGRTPRDNPSGYTPHTTGDSIPTSVFDGTHHFTPRDGDRQTGDADLLTTGESRKTDKTTDKSANTESEYTKALERAQNLLQVFSGGEGSVSPFTPRDPITPREPHLAFKDHEPDSQDSSLKAADTVDGLLKRVDGRLGESGEGSISDFDQGGDDVPPGNVVHSRIRGEDDSEFIDQDDTYANIWPSQREEQGESDMSDVEATFIQPKPLNDVSSANFANALDMDTFGPITTFSQGNTLGTSDTYFEMTQTAPFSGQDFQFESTGNQSENMEDIIAYVPRPTEKLDFVMDNDLAISVENENDSGEIQTHQHERDETLMVEDPTLYKQVSRTSLSDKQHKPKGKSARRAAMYRREYEHHRHGNDSSSDGERESHERHRSGSRSRRSSQRSRSQSSQGSHSHSKDVISMENQTPQALTFEEKIAHKSANQVEDDEEVSDPDTVQGRESQYEARSMGSGSVSTVRDGQHNSDSDSQPVEEGDNENQDVVPGTLPSNASNNSSHGFDIPSSNSSENLRAGEDTREGQTDFPQPADEIIQKMRIKGTPLPNGHVRFDKVISTTYSPYVIYT